MQNAHPEIWRSHPEKLHPPYFQNLIGLTGMMENPIGKKRRKVERDVVESCPGIFARRAYTLPMATATLSQATQTKFRSYRKIFLSDATSRENACLRK
jgi:hypothetical protein